MSSRRLLGYQISKWAILFVFTLGAGPLGFFLWQCHAIRRAQQWPTVEATVVGLQVTSTTNLIEGILGNRVVQNDEIAFSFDYMIAGRQYLSHRFCVFGYPPAHVVATTYPLGHHFTARYDPLSPEIAVAEPGSVDYRLLVVSLICLALGAAGMMYNHYRA